jgi:hypothetical protein
MGTRSHPDWSHRPRCVARGRGPAPWLTASLRLVVALAGGLLASAGAPLPAAWAGAPATVDAPDAYRDATADYAAWAADPVSPGPDLPPRGRSLFDHLVAVREAGTTRLDVPFPFSRLVERIQATLSAQQGYNGGTRQVMIPMGRSLQRTATAPDFFRFPRIVFAVTGEASADREEGAMLLKDRLYIGYVEKTAMLEVVSYNEAAGRFEFQLVKDYRPGGTPRIQYANRAVCVSCHQNHAPIFAGAIWSETSANGRIAEQLRAHRKDFDQSAIANIDFPDDIEKAAVRGNALVPLQTAWRTGCAADDAAAAARCRAAALTAVMQWGLSGGHDFDSGTAAFADDFAATFARAWKGRWPDGMKVGSPILPDRNPFGSSTSFYGGNSDEALPDWTRTAHVPPALDPLNPRPPRETWRYSGALDAGRFVSGWATLFGAEDFLAVDRHLARFGRGEDARRTRYRAHCRVSPSTAGAGAAKCTGDGGSGRPIDFAGTFDPSGAVHIDWINFGPAGRLREATFEPGTVSRDKGDALLRARPTAGAATPRLPDGRALESIALRWHPLSGARAAGPARTAEADIVLVDDFALLRGRLAALVATRADLLGDGPLSRARVMKALFQEDAWTARHWCCDEAPDLPAARLDTAPPVKEAMDDPSLRPFFQQCAMCHLSRERFPPNFLAGDAGEVGRRVRHCAPRMWVRLSSWIAADRDRTKSPMPPALFVRSLGAPPGAWAHGTELREIRERVARFVSADGGPADPDALLTRDYESLPACLPEDAEG